MKSEFSNIYYYLFGALDCYFLDVMEGVMDIFYGGGSTRQNCYYDTKSSCLYKCTWSFPEAIG